MRKKKLIIITSIMMILSFCSFVHAESISDLTTGPGVGLSESSWNMQGKVYIPGSSDVANINWQLSLHRIDDNGPGANIDASIVNPVSIYGNVGPGANIIIAPSQDKGPIYADITTLNVDPANALLDMGPASSTEFYQHKKKNN